jgi:anti-anti-sigma regulatory factor
MAKNFRVLVHRSSPSLHLKPVGDLDGSSAHVLLNTLKDNMHGVSRVFVHTSSLKNIDPFGRNMFQSGLDSLGRRGTQIIFTGENASKLAPVRS